MTVSADAHDIFSDSAAVTATAISNVIDLGATPTTRNLGAGEPIYLMIVVEETTASAGATTVDFTLESDSTADLATSPTTHITVSGVAKATLVDGYRVFAGALPSGNYERYLGVRYTVNTANLTAGKFSAFLTPKPQNWTAYPDGIA